MRSISSTGMSWIAVRPDVDEPTRTPSTRNSTWSDSAPRMNNVDNLPAPPWLTRLMPARPRSSSGSECACVRSISLRSITSTAASESSTVMAVRVPVTTTRSSSCEDAASCASANEEDRDSANATAPAREGRNMGTTLQRARPRAFGAGKLHQGSEADGGGVRVATPRPHDALRIATSRAPWPVSGLARRIAWLTPRFAAFAPSRANAQWRLRRPVALTVAGAAPELRSVGIAHRLPVSTLALPSRAAPRSPRSGRQCSVNASGWCRSVFAGGLVEQPERGRRVLGVCHLGGGDGRGGGPVARRRQQRGGGVGGKDEFAAARLGHVLPMAIEQGAFQRIQQVEAGLEAGALHAHEGIDRADRFQVLARAQAHLAQPGRTLRADVPQLHRAHPNVSRNRRAISSSPS